MKVNAIKCLKCNDIIYSRSRHDFKFCSCKSTAIDGGFDYMKVSFDPKIGYESVDLELDVEKKDLIHDYNYAIDQYGLIKEEK
jgi:hypothetical protein